MCGFRFAFGVRYRIIYVEGEKRKTERKKLRAWSKARDEGGEEEEVSGAKTAANWIDQRTTSTYLHSSRTGIGGCCWLAGFQRASEK